MVDDGSSAYVELAGYLAETHGFDFGHSVYRMLLVWFFWFLALGAIGRVCGCFVLDLFFKISWRQGWLRVFLVVSGLLFGILDILGDGCCIGVLFWGCIFAFFLAIEFSVYVYFFADELAG